MTAVEDTGSRPADGGGPVALGVDVGTSGVRVAALEARGAGPAAFAGCRFADLGGDPRAPAAWRAALEAALDALLAGLDPGRVRAIAVDGTSGTVLGVDAAGRPVGAPLMYDERAPEALVARVSAAAPAASAAGGPSSALAKALHVVGRGAARAVHQADWIAGTLGGDFAASDANNALKTGFDPVRHEWPDWIEGVGMDRARLPAVHVPGTALGTITRATARRFSLAPDVRLVAGTTDGCASFLATGAREPGEAVTALGSTLVLKVLSDRPLFAPEYGLYSHRVGGAWLAGGASNAGGRVLARHFDAPALAALSARIDPARPSGLDYYPLLEPGERFPTSDPALAPRLEPRPDDDARFLHGMLESMARIEAEGYARLAEIGAPALASVRTVGGGAANAAWTGLRRRALGVPFARADSEEAAVGTARLALAGLGVPDGGGDDAGGRGAPVEGGR